MISKITVSLIRNRGTFSPQYTTRVNSSREVIRNYSLEDSFKNHCKTYQKHHIYWLFDNGKQNGFTSPCGLMPGVTLERMKEGYSKIRNRALAHAFSYMNLIEAWGSGIPKLMKAMEDYGLPEPEFIEMEIAFRINLYRSQVGLNTNQADRETNQGTNQVDQDADQANQVMDFLGKEERQLMQLVIEKPEITQREMARQLGWSLGKVKYYITKLKKNHVLERAGSSQKGQWKALTEDNDKK